MRSSKSVLVVAALAALVSGASRASAVVLADWRFNASSSAVALQPTTGTGSAGAYRMPPTVGGPIALTMAGAGLGSASDTIAPTTSNRSIIIFALAAGGQSNPSADKRGFRANSSTAGWHTPTVSFDLVVQARASRFWQLFFTSDNGASWSIPTSGTASVTPAAFNVASATLSGTGLISITSNVNTTISASTATDATGLPGSFTRFSYTLPTGTSFDQAAGFGFALIAVPDPAGTDYVSSATGLTVADTTTGYTNSGTTNGRILIDMVSITAIPEPSAAGLLLAGLPFLSRRRR